VELTASDLVELTNLVDDYVFSIDRRDIGRFAELWAEDAVYRFNRNGVSGIQAPLFGRDAIVEAMAGFFEHADAGWEPGRFMRHLCTAPRLAVDGDEVTGTTGMLSIRQELVDGEVRIGLGKSGLYFDRFRRERGRWVFAERTVAWDPPEREGVVLPVELYGRVP
jgi:hypothetical protein